MLTAETTPPVGSAGSTAIPMPPAVPSDRPASQRPEIEDSGSLSAPGFLEPERHNAAGPSRGKRQHESDPATQGQLFETEPPPWYLAADEEDGSYNARQKPCPFLGDDNRCTIYDVRPTLCREYPHTDKEGFTFRTMGVANNALVCPAVFWIVEQMKQQALG